MAVRRRSLPQRVYLDPIFYIKVMVGTQAELRAALGEDDSEEMLSGCWVASFDDNDACMGTIYVEKGGRLKQRWETLRHELVHAIHDIDSWLHARGEA